MRVLNVEAKVPIEWRIALTRPRAEVFAWLTEDARRERYWSERSCPVDARRFKLEFAMGVSDVVEILECRPPERLRLRYFAAECLLELTEEADGATVLTVRDWVDEPCEWLERRPGWVSWLLVFKAAVEHGIDLRNGSRERAWDAGFVDQ